MTCMICTPGFWLSKHAHASRVAAPVAKHHCRAVPLQVVYAVNSRQHTRGMVVAGAGRGDDVVASLNPAAGRGLTHLLRFGSAPHQRTRGSGVGGTLRLSPRVHASAAHLIDAGACRPPCGLSSCCTASLFKSCAWLYRSACSAETIFSHNSPLCIPALRFSVVRQRRPVQVPAVYSRSSASTHNLTQIQCSVLR